MATHSTYPRSVNPKIMFGIAVVVVFAAAAVGYFQLRGAPKQFTEHSAQVKTSPSPSPGLPHQDVVVAFFTAVQHKDKTAARAFISPTANRTEFESTFANDNSTPSLYTTAFTYKILETTLSEDKQKAFTTADLTVEKQTIHTTAQLENLHGQWLLTNMESVLYQAQVPSYARAAATPGDDHRVVIGLDGPAEMYITSPEGRHHGFDPKTQKYVTEIADAFYSSRTVYNQRSFSVTSFQGTWKIQVVGRDTGSYTMATQLVDKENGQTGFVKGEIQKGQIVTYMASYPTEKGQPLQLTKVE